jgi:hydrogenase maturation protein HypF
MPSTQVHITGIVQGVGFRPFVYGLATRLGLQGWVRNTSAGVDIAANGSADRLEAFIRALREEAPPLARIDDITVSFGPDQAFRTFEIIPSESIPSAFQPISPDVAICDDCLRELFDPNDRRYRYPFINCTNCGPRFTIIQDIPYDRPRTTMAPFRMCPDCEREYNDPADRRFHAQPVACPVCGPQIAFERLAAGIRIEGSDALQATRVALRAGEIVAIKGLGGFHLACDATNAKAVRALRDRKLRVDKPFALMMYDVETVASHCFVSPEECALLTSPERPIVLLKRKPGSTIAEEVAPNQAWLGVMLPYTPLHYLLLEKAADFPQALVMTSGNLAEEPIAIHNDEARQRLSRLADSFLLHDREIHIRCDDSVVRVFNEDGRSLYPIRRSRGYAPFPVKLPFAASNLLAVGSELKNTFCLTHQGYAFLSHHIGDMQNYETLRSFEQGVEHFERLFRVRPEAIACDMHPNYLATRYAQERAQREGLPVVQVQHHHAHVAACMSEHGLQEPVIGVSFDGTGYGEDGAIWGGEFMVTDYKSYQRPFHLEYFPLPGGDAAIKKPARTALALLWALGLDWEECLAPVGWLGETERSALRAQLEKKINTPVTSSMGRLFDAAAALAGVRQEISYEGQAAIEFEALVDAEEDSGYAFAVADGQLQVKGAIEGLLGDVRRGVPVQVIAARFHNGLADAVRVVARCVRQETGIGKIVLSGGVWQNLTLLRRTLSLLRAEGFEVYIHREVPTNDGGLSLGQAVIAASRLRG